MLCATRLSLIPAVVAAWLLMPAPADAIDSQVNDRGKFFTPETVKKANDVIARIKKEHKKDVVVETYASIPEDVLKKFKYDVKNREPFFRQWAKDLAMTADLNGILILIAKDQNHDNSTWIEEFVGDSTQSKAFTMNDRAELHKIFGRAKNRNDGLLQGLQFIDSQMTAHHAPAQSNKKSSTTPPAKNSDEDRGSGIMGWVCIGLAALAGIWLVMGLVRAFSGGGGGGGRPGYGGGGFGGGGFMSGLMGGLFGAMAGSWIYNNMFGGHSSFGGSTAQAGEPPATGQDDFGPPDHGFGDAGGGDVGGDWGSGGGDAGGGGDVGGGDWGGSGGDFGGGGDMGGGGGDW